MSGATGSEATPSKLFVGGLSWQTSSEKLREYFGMFGPVTDVLIMKDLITQRSRGFGFITFQEASSVDKVLKVPIHTLDGKKIDPKHATPKNRPKQPNKTKKIFVGGVSQDTSADEVKAHFGQFGKVEETVMLMDQQTKRHRGFGFVTFENEESVDHVCEIHFHTVKNKKVECKRAQPKEAVVASAPLALGKRLVLAGGLRAPMPAGLMQTAGGAQGACGRLMYPTLGYARYAPYAVPAPAPAAPPTVQQAVPPAAYHGFSLAGVDMSSFQGVDWSSMYGMGMYV